MRNPKYLFPFVCLAAITACQSTTSSRNAVLATGPRVMTSFDPNWEFLKADCTNGEQIAFDDSSWKKITVPHDWSIEGPFDEHAPATGAGAFLPAGIGWYRKHFTLPASAAGHHVFIDFDGVMANSDVWINGYHLGKRPFGYVGFRYELTGHLNTTPGADNVLAVRADDAMQPASRWYAGAGIYRHVRMVITDPVHLDTYGTFVTTPSITDQQATVHVQNAVINQSDSPRQVSVKVTLIDPASKKAGTIESTPQTIAPGEIAIFDQDLAVVPQLWDLEHPNMYHAISEVRSNGKTLDDDATSFGIRDAEFKPESGFWLNGKNFKIKGAALHAEAGGVGAAVPLAAWEHRLAALKALGCNAIRTAHNPPAPEFLDLCDRMGFLVMDEMFDCWTVAKNPYDYHLYFKDWSIIDERDIVRRDRNHPSIILYCAGNEIHDTPHPDIAIPILKSLVETFHENDPTRAVTQALFRPNVSHDYNNGLADLLDVIGTNYRDTELLKAHADKPTRKIVGTEFGPTLTAWAQVRDHPEYSGYFLWTGADYLGESRRWPIIHHESGLIDITDTPHPIAYQRQSWWSDKPMVHIVRDEGTIPTGNIPGEPQTRARQSSDWSPANADPHNEKVLVYSNCDSVELFLNGQSLGAKDRPADESPRSWQVSFQPGEIKAVAKNKREIVGEHILRTAGKPAKIQLTVNRESIADNWDDLAFATASIVDDQGTVIPGANDLITFTTAGPGTVAVTENTNPSSLEPFQSNQTHAYRGQATALIKATAPSGAITLTASAPGLESAPIILKATP